MNIIIILKDLRNIHHFCFSSHLEMSFEICVISKNTGFTSFTFISKACLVLPPTLATSWTTSSRSGSTEGYRQKAKHILNTRGTFSNLKA